MPLSAWPFAAFQLAKGYVLHRKKRFIANASVSRNFLILYGLDIRKHSRVARFAETYFIDIDPIRSFRACGHNKLCPYTMVLACILGIKVYTEFTTLIKHAEHAGADEQQAYNRVNPLMRSVHLVSDGRRSAYAVSQAPCKQHGRY